MLMANKRLLLYRDEFINIDHGYVHKVQEFDFVSGILT
jgi:histidinol phosphatase-like enzyme